MNSQIESAKRISPELANQGWYRVLTPLDEHSKRPDVGLQSVLPSVLFVNQT